MAQRFCLVFFWTAAYHCSLPSQVSSAYMAQSKKADMMFLSGVLGGMSCQPLRETNQTNQATDLQLLGQKRIILFLGCLFGLCLLNRLQSMSTISQKARPFRLRWVCVGWHLKQLPSAYWSASIVSADPGACHKGQAQDEHTKRAGVTCSCRRALTKRAAVRCAETVDRQVSSCSGWALCWAQAKAKALGTDRRQIDGQRA